MSARILYCDQAVFTSIRMPTGEGYRITACSRGFRPDIKQVITRQSPSQDALCWSPEQSGGDDVPPRYAASFYAVPNDRLCVAYSCYAGAEHSGRGGERVYTLNVVFRRSDFALCGYNPFTVLRAMIAAGVTTPLLKPPPVLPPLELPIDELPGDVVVSDVSPAFNPNWRAYLLHALDETRQFVVNLPEQWLAAAESVLIGLPGERRADVSFCAGLRYSVARPHNLNFLSDDGGRAKARMAGRPEQLIEPLEQDAPPVAESQWLSFVMRHWRADETATLARRTSVAFGDTSPEGCERVGKMYNEIDGMRQQRTKLMLAAAASHLLCDDGDAETDVAAELVIAAQGALLNRFSARTWDEIRELWPSLCSISRQSTEGRLFAQPLIERALKVAGKSHPIAAADAALDLTNPAGSNSTGRAGLLVGSGHDALIDGVLVRLADWARTASGQGLERLVSTCRRWQIVRPRCPLVAELQSRCQEEQLVKSEE